MGARSDLLRQGQMRDGSERRRQGARSEPREARTTSDLRETLRVRLNDVASQRHALELTIAVVVDQTSTLELFEVMRQRCCADVVHFKQGRACALVLGGTDVPQKLIAPRRRKRLGDPLDFGLAQLNSRRLFARLHDFLDIDSFLIVELTVCYVKAVAF